MQYGCGASAPEGWLNFDASPTLLVEKLIRRHRVFPRHVRYGNIVRGLPVAEGTCAGIYASHVLEHLALDDFRTALANTRRMLAPGGVFRLVVPDLERMCHEYAGAHAFMRDSGLGHVRRPGLRALFGNSAHLWMWDEASMMQELRDAGFARMRRAGFGDNPEFHAVEDPERWKDCLGMEAVRT